jgi:hypothetical protein
MPEIKQEEDISETINTFSNNEEEEQKLNE